MKNWKKKNSFSSHVVPSTSTSLLLNTIIPLDPKNNISIAIIYFFHLLPEKGLKNVKSKTNYELILFWAFSPPKGRRSIGADDCGVECGLQYNNHFVRPFKFHFMNKFAIMAVASQLLDLFLPNRKRKCLEKECRQRERRNPYKRVLFFMDEKKKGKHWGDEEKRKPRKHILCSFSMSLFWIIC